MLTAASPRWNNSDGFGSSWLISNKEFRSKNGVGWSQWSWTAEWLIPKVEARKNEEGGGRLEPGASLSLFWPSTAEAKCLKMHCVEDAKQETDFRVHCPS